MKTTNDSCKQCADGVIVKGIAGFYYVKSGDAVYRCKARGIFKQRGIKPAVGDRVKAEIMPGNDDGLITDIMDRKNEVIRPFVVNVDCFIVVASAIKPAPVTAIIDRFLVMAERIGADVIMCINKCDMENGSGRKADAARENISSLRDVYENLYPLVCLDSLAGKGFEALRDLIEGKTSALAGPSGVGKSTILNRLIPHAKAQTGSISTKSQRGKHTTRHCELFTIDEGTKTRMFDTPGFASFDIPEMDESELQRFFPEMAHRSEFCRYRDCRHVAEPGCEIRRALRDGEISASRYASYLSMLKDIKKTKHY